MNTSSTASRLAAILADVGRLWMFIATGAVLLLLAVLFGLAYPRTKYARDYSPAKFRKIEVGMGTNDVLRILGRPLSKGSIGAGISVRNWRYSKDDEGGLLDIGYYERYLLVSNGVVVKKGEYLVWGRMAWER